MPLRLTVLALLCVLALPASASGHHNEVHEVAKPKRVASPHALSAMRTRVATHRRATWTCQRSLRRALYRSHGAERRTKSIAYVRWIERRWKQRHARCQRELSRRSLPDIRYAPGANSWLRAVAAVQVAYPGTDGWLISCSASEGGHGRWVPNSQGSGVGGWMQMYPSTFWRMFGAAKADAEARGFIVPRSAASWYSPLGQALGSAWGLTHGRRGEWMGGGC